MKKRIISVVMVLVLVLISFGCANPFKKKVETIDPEDYCMLQINLTRENTKADDTTNLFLALGDALMGTDTVGAQQFDIAVYMDDELVDVIPYNEPMRYYVFQVEKGSFHTLLVRNASTDDMTKISAENFCIDDNEKFAYKVNSSVGGDVHLKWMDPSYDYDYEEDEEFIKGVTAAVIGTACVVSIMNEFQEVNDTNQYMHDHDPSNPNSVENLEAWRAQHDADVAERDAALLQQKIDKAWDNYNYLESSNPYGAITEDAYNYAESLGKPSWY